MGDNYSATISGAGTVWYSAWTFDLPIKVNFTPTNADAPAPEVELDFTCQQGIYEDSILCSLFCPSSDGVAFVMPHKAHLEKEGDTYTISMGKTYRDLLLKMGISYNVEVYVKVNYKSAGTIALVPDTLFSDCMDEGRFIHLGDTIHVQKEDADTHVVLPYIQWREDSIRYVWNGTAPVTVAVANTCGINPLDNTDERIVDWFSMQPGDTIKRSADSVKYYAEFENAQAGMYYGKFYSAEQGEMTIERIPVAPPRGNAVLMEYDKPVVIPANSIDSLYAIRHDTLPIVLNTPTNYAFHMFVGKTHDFDTTQAIADYFFTPDEEGQVLYMSKTAMTQLWQQASGSYLYVRFDAPVRTQVTTHKWNPSPCAAKWDLFTPGTINITPSGQGVTYYRMHYAAWKVSDIQLKSTVNQACPMLIGDTCLFDNTSAHVVYQQPISRKGNAFISASTIAQWADRVDDEGNLYVRFNTTGSGTITITPLHHAIYDYEDQNACDSLVLYGKKYTEEGEYVLDTVVKASGDSIIHVLRLTLGHTYYDETSAVECEYWESMSGKIFTESGTYQDTIPGYAGCDVIVTVHLTIYKNCMHDNPLIPAENDNQVPAKKAIENGQVIILRGGKKYNILGIHIL